jgi:membrane associated rhomboid family serine protease
MGFFRMGRRTARPARFRFNLGGKWTNLTAFLVTGCVTLFVFSYGNRPSTGEPSSLMTLLSFNWTSVADGQIWRIFSAPFVFSGMLQLFFASMAVYFFGGYVARRLGFFWFMFAYTTCGITAAVASCIAVPSASFGAAVGATYGIIFLCVLYFPYMYFLGGATAKQLGPVLMGAVMLSSLNFDGHDLAYLVQLASLPVAYAVYKLEPAVERLRNRRRLRREIVDAFTEAEREEHLDKLLQKVAREGMGSLNKKERQFLQTVSKEYRRKKVKNNH